MKQQPRAGDRSGDKGKAAVYVALVSVLIFEHFRRQRASEAAAPALETVS
jgi:hypothetical protein